MQSSYERILEDRKQRIASLRALLLDRYPSQSKITLEIGCGNGHYLTAYAGAHKDKQCIGIDILNKRIEKGGKKRERYDLDNLVFLKAEAMEFLESLPKSITISEVFLLFPDPWPKKRHHRNRLLQEPFLTALAEKVDPGAAFYFRTDHTEYFEWGLEVLKTHPSWSLENTRDWPFEHGSVFQDRMGSYKSLVALCQGQAGVKG